MWRIIIAFVLLTLPADATFLATLPPPTLSGAPPLADSSVSDTLLRREINLCDYGTTIGTPLQSANAGATVDNGTIIQAGLNYAYLQAVVATPTIPQDALPMRQRVVARLCRGVFLTSTQIIVPPFVTLIMDGELQVFPTGTLTSNPFLPVILFAPMSNPERVTLNAASYGGNLTTTSGVVFGKNFQVASAAVVTGGSGYVTGDTITMPLPYNPQNTFTAAIFTVTATSGAVTALTPVNAASTSYPFSQSVIQQIANASNNLWTAAFSNVNSAIWKPASTSGSGTGLTFTVTWGNDFSGGTYAGASVLVGNDMIVGDIGVRGVGFQNGNATYGNQFAVMYANMNANGGRIYTSGGYYGIINQYGADNHIDYVNPTFCYLCIVAKTSGPMNIKYAVIDTPSGAAVWDDQSVGLQIADGRVFWSDGNDGSNDGDVTGGFGAPTQTGYMVILNSATQTSLTDDIKITLHYTNSGPAPGYTLTSVALTSGGTSGCTSGTYPLAGNLATYSFVPSAYINPTVTITASGGVATAASVATAGLYPMSAANAATAWAIPTNAWKLGGAGANCVGLALTPTFTASTARLGAVALIGAATNTRLELFGSNKVKNGTSVISANKPFARFVDFGIANDPSLSLYGSFDGVSGTYPIGSGNPVPNIDMHVADNTYGGSGIEAVIGAGGIYRMTGTGAPTNNSTGNGVAKPGSTYQDLSTGLVYRNTGSISATSWVNP
jgi:hypothetical protein